MRLLYCVVSLVIEAKLDGNGDLPVMGWSGYNAFMQNSGHCSSFILPLQGKRPWQHV